MPDAPLTLKELADAAVKVVRKAKEHGTPIVLWDDATGTVRYVAPEEWRLTVWPKLSSGRP